MKVEAFQLPPHSVEHPPAAALPNTIGREAFEARRRTVEQERERRMADSIMARIEQLAANVTLAMAMHERGTWMDEKDIPAFNKIRDAEITLSHLIEQNEDDLGVKDEQDVSKIRERCAVVLKQLRQMISVFEEDVKNGLRDEAWDTEPEHVIDLDSKDWETIKDTEIVSTNAPALQAQVVERNIVDSDMILSRGVATGYLDTQAQMQKNKRTLDIKNVSDAELEKTVDAAFQPYIATDTAEISARQDLMDMDVDAEIDRVFEGTESKLLSIPSSLDETRSRYVQCMRASDGILENIHRMARPSDETMHTYLIGLSKSYAEFEERLALIRRIDKPTEANAEEMAVIADAMHLIEDTRHEIHAVLNHRLESVEPIKQTLQSLRQGKTKTREELSAEQLDRQLNKKAAFKEELEGLAAQFNQLIETSNPKISPEAFMPTYAKKGFTGWLSRAFTTNQPKIKTRDLEQMISRIRQAQQRFDKAYYNKGETIHPLPVHSLLIGESTLAETWRALHETISRLDEDTSTPMSIPLRPGIGKAKAAVQEEHAKGAERQRIEQRGLARQYNEEKLQNEIRLGVPNGPEILKQIDSDPHADRLTFISSAYLVALAELIAATKTKNFEDTKEKLALFQSFNDELLENGIAIDDAERVIAEAEKITRLRPKKKSSSRAKIAIKKTA